MSFSFGGGLGATSTPGKPGGFGNFSFLGNTTTSAPAAFGTNTNPQNTGFGSTTFGQPSAFGAPAFGGAATSAPSFGFNTTTTAAAPSTGFAFGQPTNPAGSQGFGGFGTAPAPSGFGAAPAPSGFGAAPASSGFGTAPAPSGFGTAPAPSGFGSGPAPSGFGAAPAPSGFGTAPAPSGFGTGLGSSFGGFGGQPAATSSAPAGFTGFGTSLGFGAPATTSSSAFSFNTGFGQNAAAPSFGGFGTSLGGGFGKPALGGFGTFGQPFQQQPQQPVLSADEAFAQSIFNVSIYGDERDTVLAKWNYLQAMWGSGKSFYAQNATPVEITPQNYLCRFKAIGYNKMPGKDNKMGLVGLVLNKPESQMRDQKHQIITQLNQIFGNRPNIVISVDSIRAVSESKTEVVIFVQEKSQTSNETKRVLASEINNFLNQPMTRPHLNALGVEEIIPLILPDEDQLKEYLDKPPKGIDPRMWNQAKQDNPDPKKFIPVPIVGFNELKQRIKCQEKETEMHSLYLAKVQKELEELRQKHIDATAKILAHKRKLADLSHQVLHIIVKQEITRKVGMAFSPEEEILRSKLENMQALVSAPTQYKGRLNELLSQMRMQRNQWNLANINDYALDPDSTEEMKTFLSMQQKAMSFLIETANKDVELLTDVHTKMSEIVQN